MTNREVMQMALDALEGLFHSPAVPYGGVAVWRLGASYQPQQAITALREALARPEPNLSQHRE